MKLIDLLVQELPKRGGWPVKIKKIAQDHDRQLRYDYGFGPVLEVLADNHREIFQPLTGAKEELFVTQIEYEAALAASRQVEWDGVGLPPIGCECEAIMPGSAGPRWQWRKVKVAVSGIPGAEKECLVHDIETTRPAWVDEFRPIRTEAELKREETIKCLLSLIDKPISDAALADSIYDAIAAGEIKGVKLDDL